MATRLPIFLSALVVAVATANAARAQQFFVGTLTGAAANPPTASPGTGSVTLTLTPGDLGVDLDFYGLVGNATAAHIHCCADAPTNAPVAITFTGFPTGVTSGSYLQSFDLTSSATYNSTFLTNFGGGTAAGGEAALTEGLKVGRAYVCVHTTTYPGGELRSYPLGIFIDGFENGDWLAWSAAVP